MNYLKWEMAYQQSKQFNYNKEAVAILVQRLLKVSIMRNQAL